MEEDGSGLRQGDFASGLKQERDSDFEVVIC